MKFELKESVVKLRKLGFSYAEILRRVPVAKSTISLWLRSVGLSIEQKQKLSAKRLDAAKRGGQRKREQRLINTEKIKQAARVEVKKLSKNKLWLMGVMLY